MNLLYNYKTSKWFIMIPLNKMGNTNSSYINQLSNKMIYYEDLCAELQEKNAYLTKQLDLTQTERAKLDHKLTQLYQSKKDLVEDLKTERITRIHFEKNISNLMSRSVCDTYMESYNNKVLDDNFEKKQLVSFLNYLSKQVSNLTPSNQSQERK